MKILASVVTYNRLELLKRCFTHIQSQSRAPDEILIIDNKSTDGTESYFNQGICKYIRQENLGSSGGWNTAIRYAQQNGFDAIWLMDDDGFPDKDALLELERNISLKHSCISSIVLCEDNKDRFVFPFPKISKHGLPSLFSFPRKFEKLSILNSSNSSKEYPFVNLFNGALIRVSSTKAIGNVNTDYFMFGDEVDYFFRLRKVGIVSSLKAAKHYHPDVTKRPLTKVKIYYYLRNSIILNKKYFNFYLIRSFFNIIAIMLRVPLRNGFLNFFSLFFWKLERGFLSRDNSRFLE